MVGPDSEPSPQPPSGHSHTGPTGRSGGWGGCFGLRAAGDRIQSRWDVKVSGGFWNCPWEVRKVPGFQQLRVVTRSPGAFAPHPLAPMATLLAGEGSSGLVPWFLTSFGRR